MNNSQAIFHPLCCERGYLIDELADYMQIGVSVLFLSRWFALGGANLI